MSSPIVISPEALPPPVPPIWFVERCEICDAEQVFIAGGLGLVACCLGCGDERIAPFMRTNSEVG